MNFLIDENLSPQLVRVLAERGCSAQHAAHVGLAGSPDAIVWWFAFQHDQVVVTANWEDFLQLASSSDIHPGLIAFRQAGLKRDAQVEWLLFVIDILGSATDLVNEVIEVSEKGVFTRRELSRANRPKTIP